MKDPLIAEADYEVTPFFTEYLEETYERIEAPFTSLKWLQHLDADSLAMLYDYIQNFDERTPMSEVDEDEARDMLQLVERIVGLEIDKESWATDYPKASETVPCFCALIVLEGMARKGFLKLHGSGRITDENTKQRTTYELTAKGKKASLKLSRLEKYKKKD